MNVVVDRRSVYLTHDKPEDVMADRVKFKQGIEHAIQQIEVTPQSHEAIIKGYEEVLQEAVGRVTSFSRSEIVEPGLKLVTRGYFSVTVDWSTGRCEIVGLD